MMYNTQFNQIHWTLLKFICIALYIVLHYYIMIMNNNNTIVIFMLHYLPSNDLYIYIYVFDMYCTYSLELLMSCYITIQFIQLRMHIPFFVVFSIPEHFARQPCLLPLLLLYNRDIYQFECVHRNCRKCHKHHWTAIEMPLFYHIRARLQPYIYLCIT